jgi:23S rRNA (uracil1939-C5)-methyltransferase
VTWSVQPYGGNPQRGLATRPLRGLQSLDLEICGVVVTVGPLGFVHANPRVAGLAYAELVSTPAGLPVAGAFAVDLHRGIGITTELLRARFATVLSCEEDPGRAAQCGIAARRPAEVLGELLLKPSSGPELVVAHPPRAGLGEHVCRLLNELRAPHLHMLSASPASLAQDLEQLTGPTGGYTRVQLAAYETLPQTAHVELVAWLAGRPRTA